MKLVVNGIEVVADSHGARAIGVLSASAITPLTITLEMDDGSQRTPPTGYPDEVEAWLNEQLGVAAG
jgi:hypothetical protein